MRVYVTLGPVSLDQHVKHQLFSAPPGNRNDIDPSCFSQFSITKLLVLNSNIQINFPVGSMYCIFPYIYHKNPPFIIHVGKYTSPIYPMGFIAAPCAHPTLLCNKTPWKIPSWWFQVSTHLKNMQPSNWESFPQVGVEHKKCWKPPPGNGVFDHI